MGAGIISIPIGVILVILAVPLTLRLINRTPRLDIPDNPRDPPSTKKPDEDKCEDIRNGLVSLRMKRSSDDPEFGSNRTKRTTHDWMRGATCQQIAAALPDQRILPNPAAPIVYIGFKTVRRGQQAVNVVTQLQAALPNRIMDFQYCRDRPPRFGNEWEERMVALGRRPTDHRGHLLANQLCGPIEWYNLAPQTPAINNNRGYPTGWINVENNIAAWLRGCGRVHVQIFLNYGNANSVRPKGFKYCVTALRPDGGAYYAGFYFNNEEPDRNGDDADPQ